MTIEHQEVWQRVLGEMELNISRANFITWLQNTVAGEIKEDNSMLVYVPNSFTKEWLEKKYHKSILKTIRNIVPKIKNVEYEVSLEFCRNNRAVKAAGIPEQDERAEIQPGIQELTLTIDREANLNPRYTFESFVVGSFNELAHAAALAVTKNLGAIYNPLFLYGGVGLGKTHLLQAIGNRIKTNYPEMKIQYLTSEKFTEELVKSIQNQEVEFFKNKYRKYNLLIIDDIQFIAGKNKSQEELFHLFNRFYEANKQIVFSSDRPPKYIADLEERLRSRFEGGMMVDISEPEYEARLAILQAKVLAQGFPLSEEILEKIAFLIQKNIRELEGALNSIIARSKLLGKTLTIKEAEELLNKNIKPVKAVTATQIIKVVADFYNIQEKMLSAKTRRREIVKPRQVAMYLLREDFESSYPYIGQKFGGRDHTTVIHAYEKICRDLKQDKKLTEEMKSLRNIIYKEGV